MKRVGILALVLVAVLLTGCLSPKITLFYPSQNHQYFL